jgi:hypothetical protein
LASGDRGDSHGCRFGGLIPAAEQQYPDVCAGFEGIGVVPFRGEIPINLVSHHYIMKAETAKVCGPSAPRFAQYRG